MFTTFIHKVCTAIVMLRGICKGARELGLIHQQEEPYFQYATFLDNMTVSTAKTISETVDLDDDKEDTVRFEGYRIPKTKFQESVVKNLLSIFRFPIIVCFCLEWRSIVMDIRWRREMRTFFSPSRECSNYIFNMENR